MNYLALVGWIVLCEGVGVVGGYATSQSVRSWYPKLRKATFNPPPQVFAPVWTTLYLLMAISAWMVSSQAGSAMAIGVFLVQLGLNLAWSFIFFANKNPRAALAELAVLDVAVIWTMINFAHFSLAAAWFLVPYLAWVSFATLLNEEIVRLNPDL